jgi:nicotinate-nucleotide adenylyltransferase
MAKIGIFSGTFDPVHDGHIAFALGAQQAAGLDRVILLPERCPRGKADCTPLTHRAAMLELAVRPHPQLAVLQVQSEQFLVARTLPELRALFLHDELFLLLGSDVAKGLPYWPSLSALLDEMQLIIGVRGRDEQGALTALLAAVPGVRNIFTPSPQPHATSSSVREGTASALPAVTAYIAAHDLYN